MSDLLWGLRMAWSIYTCCRCGQNFTRWPVLVAVLRQRGIVCPDHREKEEQ